MSVYLDHNATTPVLPEVRRAMREAEADAFANPSSVHGPGQRARALLDAVRRRVAARFGAEPDEVVFTASGTESVTTALLGVPGHGTLVTSAVEHGAGERAARVLEARGHRVVRIAPDADGRVDPATFAAALDGDTRLVSLIHAQHETGVIQPVAEVGEICRARGVPFHVDAVQSAGRIPVDRGALGADLLSIAGHKFGGPRGAAALIVRRGVVLEPLLPGPQEGGRRGGTTDVLAAVGLGAAVDLLGEALAAAPRLLALRERIEEGASTLPGARVTGHAHPRLPSTVHLTFDPAAGPDLVPALDLAGYAVSAGAACASGSAEPSPALLAQGIAADRARTAVRVSLGRNTTEEEVAGFLVALRRVLGSTAGGTA